MLRAFYLICLMLAANLCYGFAAGKPVKQKAVLKADSASTINVRYFNADKLNAYSKQPEFQYKDPATGPSLWTRFWRWFWNLFDFSKIKNVHFSKFWTYFFRGLKYLLIAGGIAALVFLILKLAGVDMLNIFRRKPVSAGLEYSELLENIHEINFDDEIEKAIASHNYRLAVRLLYLKSLKQLSDANLIDWQVNKTNSAYIFELTNDGQRNAFKQLTHQFEYVWYGEFLIDQQAFQQINILFQRFKQQLA